MSEKVISEGTAAPRRKKRGGAGRPFSKGDPRINRQGRPPLSERQREFRQKLHDMEPDILRAAKALVLKKNPAVVAKLIEKLGGADSINVRVQIEREQEAFLALAKEALTLEEYEKLLAAYAAKRGGG